MVVFVNRHITCTLVVNNLKRGISDAIQERTVSTYTELIWDKLRRPLIVRNVQGYRTIEVFNVPAVVWRTMTGRAGRIRAESDSRIQSTVNMSHYEMLKSMSGHH